MNSDDAVLILDYLVHIGRASVDSEGKVGWVYYPEVIEQRGASCARTNLEGS